MANRYPSYLNLLETGELRRRVEVAREMLRSCHVCPRHCGANRLEGEAGFCLTADVASVASYNDHHGEEPCISGIRGSGVIFFTSCNLKCVFCQNFPISHLQVGQPATRQRLAEMMLELQARGVHNINFVTPSHVVPQIIESLLLAAERGLHIPLVYNTSGYDSLESLSLLDGIVDIYLPDAKYGANENALVYSKVAGYVEANRAALKEMWRQVGPVELDDAGLARRGMILRHLVLPHNISWTREVLGFVARELSPDVTISLMNQYFPANQAHNLPELNRKLTVEEYEAAANSLLEFGLDKGYVQKNDYLEVVDDFPSHT
jgi:putative pyruvate formate lyase activating enzyme